MRLGELDASTNLCDNNRNLCAEPQDYEIESIIHHSNYDLPKYANDVALIRLRQTTNSSEFIDFLLSTANFRFQYFFCLGFTSPLCLPLGNYESADKNLQQQTGLVAGWGISTSGLLF